jgi:hypothetical protein
VVSVGDLDRLTGLDPPQQLARPLPEFTDSYCRHVLVVAHGDARPEASAYHPGTCHETISAVTITSASAVGLDRRPLDLTFGSPDHRR